MSSEYFIGVTLAAGRGALAVVDRDTSAAGWDAVKRVPKTVTRQSVRGLERMAFGPSLVEAAARITAVAKQLAAQGTQCTVVVDANPGVIELLEAAGARCWVRPVTLTNGKMEELQSGVSRVPRAELLAGLQVMIELRSISIVRGLGLREELMRELKEARFDEVGGELVRAVALAGWGARRWVAGDMAGKRRLI